MTLQEIIGELTNYNMTARDETPVYVRIHGQEYDQVIDHLALESDETGYKIVISLE